MKDSPDGSRIVITVIGPDRVGIIAAVSVILAGNGINILDISQTIMQEFFVMVLVADMAEAKIDLVNLKDLLARKGEELKVRIDAQHEDVFNFMHRI
ncbi:MAG TPA: ACT domain-containing protein [Firmicutes bacterium]|nr:ACT domain-containing protein [Bacillota bacterium]